MYMAAAYSTKAFGVITSKPTSTTCVVGEAGVLSTYVGLLFGVEYFLSVTPGEMTDTPPSLLGEIVQRLGEARNATTLILDIDAQPEEL